MRAIFHISLTVVLAIAAPGMAADPPAKPATKKSVAADEFFGLTKVHSFHLVIAAKDFAAMQPAQPAMPFGPGGGRPGGAGRPALGSPEFGAGRFGFEFEYVPGDVVADGHMLKNIGIRYKGNGTYLVSARAAKRSFKLEFDHYDSKLAYYGLKKLNLNSGVMDPTRAREALAFTVFRAAGVPTPRTAFAEVTLSVPGKYDKEYLGVYTVVEQVDKAFLKNHFNNANGLLLKPEGIRGLPHFGDDATAYEKSYNPKSKVDPDKWKKLAAFTRLVNKAEPAEFQKQIRSHLDVNAFVNFLAASTLLVSLDGFTGLGHNYYLYLSPKTGTFAFIPWDLDLSFGSFFMFGPADQQSDVSIDHPHVGENKLIERLLAMPEVKDAYHQRLRELMQDIFSVERLGKDAAKIELTLKDMLAKDQKSAEARRDGGFGFGPPGMGGPLGAPAQSVKSFIEKRTASITAQLAGKRKGYVPEMAFGPMGGQGGFQNPLAKPLFDALDANKDGRVSEAEMAAGMMTLFKEWDKDKNGVLDQKEIADGLRRLSPPPAFGPPATPRQ